MAMVGKDSVGWKDFIERREGAESWEAWRHRPWRSDWVIDDRSIECLEMAKFLRELVYSGRPFLLIQVVEGQ